MTPAQLEHLRLLKAHLETLLKTAKKRTPGEWEYGNDAVWSDCNGEGNSPAEICYQIGLQDATFIASCAGNAEAGWKSTLTAISALSELARMINSSVPEYEGCGRDAIAHLEKILTAWPIETLTSKPKTSIN